ncbi:hypothetical protein D9757_014321 [Collybiopsis confluens]|uniref:Uncharacterized protein n=1 Tax=Collybiopsis confluens TaxID=2823264 RepID=A0A8H5FSX3_9AGAR|nr:hypothetical protein D9757_014321 [Collybiopsis confluens]
MAFSDWLKHAELRIGVSVLPHLANQCCREKTLKEPNHRFRQNQYEFALDESMEKSLDDNQSPENTPFQGCSTSYQIPSALYSSRPFFSWSTDPPSHPSLEHILSMNIASHLSKYSQRVPTTCEEFQQQSSLVRGVQHVSLPVQALFTRYTEYYTQAFGASGSSPGRQHRVLVR